MNTVLRGALVYLILLVVLRLAGKRTLSEMSTFDFVLLLVISETTQQALVGEDFSLVSSAILITTLVGLDVALSLLQGRFRGLQRVVQGLPIVLVDDGEVYLDRLKKARVGIDDILQAARVTQGLQNLDEIKFVVLEHSGGLSIIPKQKSGEAPRGAA